MNSKEVIERTLTFNGPDRLGMHYLLKNGWHSDILHAGIDCNYPKNKHVEDNLELWEDRWPAPQKLIQFL